MPYSSFFHKNVNYSIILIRYNIAYNYHNFSPLSDKYFEAAFFKCMNTLSHIDSVSRNST